MPAREYGDLYANLQINRKLYDKLEVWGKEQADAGLPMYLKPTAVVNRLIVNFLMDVTDDPELKEIEQALKKARVE